MADHLGQPFERSRLGDDIGIRIGVGFPTLALDDPARLPAAGRIAGAGHGIAEVFVRVLGEFLQRPVGQALLIAQLDPAQVEHRVLHGAFDALAAARMGAVIQRRQNPGDQMDAGAGIADLGGIANGFPRESGFDITVASEVMAIFCLATDLNDLEERIGRIVVGYTRGREPIRASDLDAQGPMTVLLKEALQPNLVQTLENNPAFIHGGPFANIAHGCNSVMATKTALKLADYVVTEAGFGADLGAEKFFNIKCRLAGLNPSATVIVATVRALKMHGGVAKDDLGTKNVDAVTKGCDNLRRHVRNVKSFGVPVVVAVNRFSADTDAEVAAVREGVEGLGVEVIDCTHWADGSKGTEKLAEYVVKMADSDASQFAPLYEDAMPLWDKAKTVATKLYGADDVIADKKVRNQFADLQDAGYGHLPVCMAKTQYSFSTDPNLKGAPSGHVVPIREVRLSAGAGFIVVVCGEIMTMPGLPRVPSAHAIHLNKDGVIEGLF